MFSDQLILLANSLLVSLVLFGLWLSDRTQRHNLYWAGGLFALFVVIATLPDQRQTAITLIGWICFGAGFATIGLLLQGTALFLGRPFAAPWLLALLAVPVAAFFALRATGHPGAVAGMLALAGTFWYMAWAFLGFGIAERLAAILFFLRGLLLVLATVGGAFIDFDALAANQVVGMASALALLFVAFQANRRELERSRRLLEQSNRLAQRLGQLTDAQSVVRESMAILLQSEPDNTIWIYRLDDSGQRLELLDAGGRLAGIQPHTRELPLDGSVSGAAVRSGRIQVVDDLAGDPRAHESGRSLARERPNDFDGTTIVIPLVCGERVYGTCNMNFRDRRRLSRADYEAYGALGQTIGLGLANAGNLEEITYRANHDALTHLPNRSALHEAFDQHAARSSETGATMFLLDLDNFKEINDTLGHHIGDQLLQRLGPRLSSIDTDARLLVTRLGGDEFALLLLQTLDSSQAVAFGERVLDMLREPFEIDGMALSVDGSLGIAICPRDGADSHELLRCADVAMYQAKSSTIPVMLYGQEFDPHSRERLALMSDLKQSISGNQLLLHFQPKVHLGTGKVIGAEGLLRWHHPELGLVAPGRFMPMAEVSPMINQISLWVLAQVIEQARSWQQLGLNVAMNVSTRNLADDSWYRNAIALINGSGIDPTRLEMEVTESVLMHEPDEAARKLNALADTGVRIAIDDFGTGYSSLNYLRKLPIHQLKIDRSFIMDLDEERADRRLVESILSLARSLELDVVAEGVESAQTLMLLRELDCDYAQGFHICRPLPPERLEAWLGHLDRMQVLD